MSNIFNKKELKNVSRDFRTISSRLLNSRCSDFDDNLKRFYLYIEKESIIKDYIISCIDKEKDYNIEKDMEEISNSYGQLIFSSYLEENEEISFTYQLVKNIYENSISYRKYVWGYSSSNQFQDKINGFIYKVISPFVTHINRYLERIFTEMGFDEDIKYYITVNEGGQFNMSRDNSTLNATQNNNNINIDEEVAKLKACLKAKNVDEKIQEEIIENAEAIQEEIKKEKPRKGLLKTLSNGLQESAKLVPEVMEVGANIATIIQFINQLF